MTFDFFNTSNLAFGAKLTGAFTQLENLANAAESHLEIVDERSRIIDEYINRNYMVARPTNKERPCRTNEIFTLVDDIKFRIDRLEYTDSKIKVKVHIFTSNNSRITVAEGESELKEGFIFYTMAKSNSAVNTELKFVKDIKEGTGNLLFEYRIDSSNIINIKGSDVANLGLIPKDSSQYTSISKGETIYENEYTAKDYECVCVVGNENNISIELNGEKILEGKGNRCLRHCIIYLKPDDRVSGTFSKLFTIKYNQ